MTAWDVTTEETVAENVAVVAAAATVTVAGTVTAALLLAKVTVVPPVGAAVPRVTVQELVPGPTTEAGVQVSALGEGGGAPLPLRLMTALPLSVELLVMVNCPLAAPAAVGANCTVRVEVPPPGATVIGMPVWLTEKELPLTVRAEIWTGEELRLTSETVAVAVLPTFTDPKLTVLGEIPNAPDMVPVVAAVDPAQPARSNGIVDSAKAATSRQPLLDRVRERLDAARRIDRDCSVAEHTPRAKDSEPNGGQNNSYISHASKKYSGQLRNSAGWKLLIVVLTGV